MPAYQKVPAVEGVCRIALKIEHNTEHVLVKFGHHKEILSSAVLNGGLVDARQLLNMKVPLCADCGDKDLALPEAAIQAYADRLGLQGVTVGMMTAASMRSFRVQHTMCEDVDVTALVTCGLTNAKRIGERAEWQRVDTTPQRAGTINIIVVVDAALTPGAMVEAAMMATEAKTACLQSWGVKNPDTGRLATGTGTDAVAVTSNPKGRPVIYCGKHVLLGEKLAWAAMNALNASLAHGMPTGSEAATGNRSVRSLEI